ncbi:hypothetical protein [Paenibacillus crassostreae]|uniref:50S ribosomal protein L33 n=1 Tax=Paenibacillus crassostreae TaxID=1763538 RepID=A0A167GU79_9BACL|nr:hypothetical protein [Paenibacillus crassostreae]AOZ92102.1 hypothetical protein LPB68_07620 [Paenibacillus crassostreae]OAB77911.1 hypothetical protein PNBC_00700 [Paenibacillus crassostreae]
MKYSVTKAQAQKCVGKNIVATKKDGTLVTGKLLRISGNRLILQHYSKKKVHTKAIIPLVLFDLLAIGTAPYVAGYGSGGYNPYASNGYNGGYGYGYGGGGGYPPGYFF